MAPIRDSSSLIKTMIVSIGSHAAHLRLVFFAILVGISLTGAHGADHNNLDEGLPTQLDDAYPIEYYGREVQTSLSYERTAESRDLFMVEPRLEFGFAPNWQGTLHVPFEFGSGAAEGIGALGAEALYNFNTEGIWLPAFAVSGRADFSNRTRHTRRGHDREVHPDQKPRAHLVFEPTPSERRLDAQ